MLGHWKNFDQLESDLSLEELTALLEVSRKKEDESRRFFAAINGIELEDSVQESDVVDLKGPFARQEGFGINEGLGFMQMEG